MFFCCGALPAHVNAQSWGNPLSPIKVDGIFGEVIGRYSSMIMIGGKPAIAYSDVGNKALRFIRANDVDGITWGNPKTLEVVDYGQAESISMEIINDDFVSRKNKKITILGDGFCKRR